jgi:hypothetical protein
MTDASHHRAHAGGPADTRIVLVPFPVAGPQYGRPTKPPVYPNQRREAWKPAQAIPRRATKAQATVELMRRIAGQEVAMREYMKQAREQARAT